MVEAADLKKRKKGNDSLNKKLDTSIGDKQRNKILLKGRFNPKLSDKHANVSHKFLAKMVIGAGAVFFLIYRKMYAGENIVPLAKVEENVDEKRYQQFLCAPSYKKEITDLEPGCLPTQCGRFTLDGLVSESEVHKLLDVAKKGLAKGGGSGGASILDLHTGALSYGEKFINLYKTNPDLFTTEDFKLYNEIKDRVKDAVATHFNIDVTKLYLSYPTFFSELTAVPPQTVHDEYWHAHVDKETYPSFHFTSLLYLVNYKRDFTGGRFVFIDNHQKMNRTIDPKEGRVSVFTSGPENKHRVEPVTGGTRYALTMGFTCDSSKRIADPGYELGLYEKVREEHSHPAEQTTTTSTHKETHAEL